MEIEMKVGDRGFTLIEVMIAAALLGGLSLVFMQLTKDTTKSSAKYQMDSDITLTTNEINAILSDPQKCITTLATIASPTNIDGKFLITTAGAPAQGYGNAGIKITNYTLTVAGNNGNLAIAYENKNILKGTSGPNSIIKNINLYVEGTPGAITKCRSLSTAASDIWRRQNPGSGIYFNEGNVGIGTTPTSDSLTVAGIIASTTGGIKFPDGSVQTSAPTICTDATKALHWDGSAWHCDTLDFTAAITAAFSALFGGASTPPTTTTPPSCTGTNQALHWNGTSWSCDTLTILAKEISGGAGSNPTCPTGQAIAVKYWDPKFYNGNCDSAVSCTTTTGWSTLVPSCTYTTGGSKCFGNSGSAVTWSKVKCI
jgi:prepilin-type N-terminal cleavage/methylation domain-containing protein